jgi:hypothetical protein
MESEKVMYWMTLGVLALATATGFVSEHRGWDRLVDRSAAVVSQASDVAAHYAEMADLMLESDENGSANPAHAVIDIANNGQDDVQAEVQSHLVCARRTLIRRQAQLVRLQAIRVQVWALKRAPRTIVLPARNMVIEIPQAPELPEDTF